jgi:hypothetical protein
MNDEFLATYLFEENGRSDPLRKTMRALRKILK